MLLHFLLPLDLDPSESDPLPGVRPAEPGGRTEPCKGRPGSPPAGRKSAGAESGCWEDPIGDHHQVSESHAGWDKPGRTLNLYVHVPEICQQGAPLHCINSCYYSSCLKVTWRVAESLQLVISSSSPVIISIVIASSKSHVDFYDIAPYTFLLFENPTYCTLCHPGVSAVQTTKVNVISQSILSVNYYCGALHRPQAIAMALNSSRTLVTCSGNLFRDNTDIVPEQEKEFEDFVSDFWSSGSRCQCAADPWNLSSAAVAASAQACWLAKLTHAAVTTGTVTVYTTVVFPEKC